MLTFILSTWVSRRMSWVVWVIENLDSNINLLKNLSFPVEGISVVCLSY